MNENKTGQTKADKKKARKELKNHKRFLRIFRFLHGAYRVILRFFYPFKRYGQKKPYNDGTYIFVCNHLSWFDVFPCALATSKPVHFICKKEILNKKIGKMVVDFCQCITVSRDGSDIGALMQSVKYIKKGENLAIFPEGTRNKTDEIFLPFKGGAATISIMTKTPVVPVVIAKRSKIFRKNHVYYGQPLEFSDYYGKKLTKEDYEACDDLLKEKMLEMYYEVNEAANAKKRKKK